MLNEETVKNLVLYYGYHVSVKMTDGTVQCGELCPHDAEECILLGEKILSLCDVEDIRYVGKVTEYHTRSNTVTIDNCFELSSEEVNKAFEPNVKYEEFEYSVSCHLYIDAKIEAKDVIVEETGHYVNKEVLGGIPFLYRIRKNGIESWLIASLVEEQGEKIVLSDTNATIHDVLKCEVTDITSVPMTNNEVIVTDKDGRQFRGIVNAVRDSYFNMIVREATGEIRSVCIRFDMLEELRYCGTVTKYQGAQIDEKYSYKSPYYLKDAECRKDMGQDRKVSYVAGVNRNGLVAKEIEIDEVVSKTVYYGIILSFAQRDSSRDDCYIGLSRKRIGRNLGDVVFTKEQLGVYACDLWTQYCRVAYTLKEHGNRKEVESIISKEVFTFAETDYEVSCDLLTGELKKQPIWLAKKEYYEGKDVDVLCMADDSGNKEVLSGTLSFEPGNQEQVFLSDSSNQKKAIDTSKIEQIRIYGKITEHMGNGQLILSNGLYSHANDVEEVNGKVEVINTFSEIGDNISYVLGVKSKRNEETKKTTMVLSAYGLRRCEQREVYVIEKNRTRYTIVDKEAYEKDDLSKTEEITAGVNAPADINQYDYRAVLMYGRSKGVPVVTDIRFKEKGKEAKAISRGYIVAYGDNYYWVAEKSAYENSPSLDIIEKKYATYYVPLADLDQYDYPAVFYYEEDGVTVRSITVDTENRVKKESVKMGQIQKFMSNKNHGYIIPWDKLNTEEKKGQLFYGQGVLNFKEELDTFRWNYNVLYDSNGTDDRYRVSVIKKVRKEAKVEVEEQLSVEGDISKETLRYNVPNDAKDSSKLLDGEMIACIKNGKMVFGKYNGGKITPEGTKDSQDIPVGTEIYRFGVLDGYDLEVTKNGGKVVEAKGTGYLNENLKFDFSEMKDEDAANLYRTRNVFLQNKKSMLLCYKCTVEEGSKVSGVRWVQVPSGELLSSIRWSEGEVKDDFDKDNKSLKITLTDSAIKAEHYLSELTNQGINRKGASNLKGDTVFVRVIGIPHGKGKGVDWYAADIHCAQEEVYVLKKGEGKFVGMTHQKSLEEEIISNAKYKARLEKAAAKQVGEKLPKNKVMLYYTINRNDKTKLVGALDGFIRFKLDNSNIAKIVIPENGRTLKQELEYRIREYVKNGTDGMFDEMRAVSAYFLQNMLREEENREINLYRLLALTLKDANDVREAMEASFEEGFTVEGTISDWFEKNMLDARSLLCYALVSDETVCRLTKDALHAEDEVLASYLRENCSDEIVSEEIKNISKDSDVLDGLTAKFTELKEKFTAPASEQNGEEQDYDLFYYLLGKEDEIRIREYKKYWDISRKSSPDLDTARKNLDDFAKWNYKVSKKYPTRYVMELFGASLDLTDIEKKLISDVNEMESNVGSPEIEAGIIDTELILGQEKIVLYCQNTADIEAGEVVVQSIWYSDGKEIMEQTNTFRTVEKKGEFSEGCQSKLVPIPSRVSKLAEGSRVTVVLNVTKVSFKKNISGEIVTREVSAENLTEKKEVALEIKQAYDKSNVINPYDELAKLKYNDKMFVGRLNQKEKIAHYLVDKKGNLRSQVVIMVSGQKRCGKTVFVNQLINEENHIVIYKDGESKVLENTRVIKYERPSDVGTTDAKMFYEKLMADICFKLSNDLSSASCYDNKKFEDYDIMYRDYEFLLEKKVEDDIRTKFDAVVNHMKNIKTYIRTNRKREGYDAEEVFTSFVAAYKVVTGKRVVVCMDEFTDICEAVKDNPETREQWLGFLTKFPSENRDIVLILIGHELMVKMLTEDADKGNDMAKIPEVRIENFTPEEAAEYITAPMRKAFEVLKIEPYGAKGDYSWGSPCGEQAVDRLINLTEGYPYYLAILCKTVLNLFKKSCKNYIVEADIEVALVGYLEQCINSKDGSKVFDALLFEKGDDEPQKLSNKELLKMVVNEGKWVEKYEATKDLLLERRILKQEKNKIDIRMPLFKRYLKKYFDSEKE